MWEYLLTVVADEIVAVEVVAQGVEPIQSLIYSIRVEHRHDHDQEVLAQDLGFLGTSDQEL